MNHSNWPGWKHVRGLTAEGNRTPCSKLKNAFLSGGAYIMEKRISTLISVYEENTKAHDLSASGTEKLILAYNQHTTTTIQQNEDITKLQDQLRSINQSLSEVHMNWNAGLLKDCQDIQRAGNTQSGIYTIHVLNYGPTFVWCDMDTDGGGWTVFQRRQDGTVDFYRRWAEYQNGFGDLNREFWLGNEILNNKRFAVYKPFHIGGISTNYKLFADNYSGDAGDSFKIHNGKQFSTYDKDHDEYDRNCAELFKGAWWYEKCHFSNLNGQYLKGETKKYAAGVVWYHWRKHNYSLKSSQMKLRRLLS